MGSGYIKIHRQLLDWEWWDDPATTRLWLYLLLAANYEDKQWHGIDVRRGQLVTSREDLAGQTGLSAQQIRTCLSRLKATSEITSESTNQYSIITICKYDDYQVSEDASQPANQPASQPASNQRINQRINQQSTSVSGLNASELGGTANQQSTSQLTSESTTTKEDIYKETLSISNDIARGKKVAASKLATLTERKDAFVERLRPFVAEYGREMVNSFFAYWTEMNPNGKKMRFEMERVYDVSRRLATWKSKEYNRTQTTDSRKHYDSDVTEYTDGSI